ncbi:RCC1 and BTB domain-containing protein 1-like isoform X2 [Linepithema humile]|uniref:RCC1 and BTB domain-containing protein 1-like isoform X2 n=1 Tax=Linepithema humile TaxID=83485 RepID=UPI00062397A4|nr:PREDICTED: RCC1 and BTB domain-containing protein 1-like isoform X2 [Linepithema humile]
MQIDEMRNLQRKFVSASTHYYNRRKVKIFWPGLNDLPVEFLLNSHMIMAIRCAKNGTSMDVFIIVKKDGNVYSCGTDEEEYTEFHGHCSLSSSEILSIVNNSRNLQIIENLCDKSIKTFVQMNTHGLFAVTNEGEVYSWGTNKLCTLGHKECEIISEPTLVISLSNKNIVNIVCGIFHALALTVDGKIYTWGMNIEKLYKKDNFQTPRQVSELEKEKIVCIACSSTYSIVVTDNGKVYNWGNLFNKIFAIGITDFTGVTISRQPYPVKRIMFAAPIIKVACGLNHALALTDEGILYVWGENRFGQLGTGDNRNIYKPYLLNTSDMGELSDIAALSTKNISVAINKNGCLYVWGNYASRIILKPKAVFHTNLNDLFACEHIMYKPLILSENGFEYVKKDSNTVRCLKDAFNDPSTSDYKVEVEGRDIHLHKAVLKICSSYFRIMFQHNWKENIENVLKLDMFSYNVYEAFFKYLYTSEIEIPPGEAFELLILADMYDEMDLETALFPKILKEVTISNVALFYSKAIGYNQQWLEEFCLSFALRNMTEVKQTESFKELDENTKTMFLIKADKVNAFKM